MLFEKIDVFNYILHDFMIVYRNFFINLRLTPIILLLMAKDINRIKVVLAEQKRTGKWLAEQIGKDQATVSKWCTNTSQPDLRTLLEVAACLNVDVKDLLWSSQPKSNNNYPY